MKGKINDDKYSGMNIKTNWTLMADIYCKTISQITHFFSVTFGETQRRSSSCSLIFLLLASLISKTSNSSFRAWGGYFGAKGSSSHYSSHLAILLTIFLVNSLAQTFLTSPFFLPAIIFRVNYNYNYNHYQYVTTYLYDIYKK